MGEKYKSMGKKYEAGGEGYLSEGKGHWAGGEKDGSEGEGNRFADRRTGDKRTRLGWDGETVRRKAGT
jgi:hypothetical protein